MQYVALGQNRFPHFVQMSTSAVLVAIRLLPFAWRILQVLACEFTANSPAWV